MTHLTRNIYTRPIQGQHNTAQGGAWSAMCRPGFNASGRHTAPKRLATQHSMEKKPPQIIFSARERRWKSPPFRIVAHLEERENQFESCSSLMHFARNHTFFAPFSCNFTSKTRLSYTRKHNPTPYPSPEIISKHYVFGV